MQRDKIKTEYKWDLSDLYVDFTEWELDLEKVKPLIEDIKKYKGNLLSSPESLLGFFEDDKIVTEYLEKLDFYAFLVSDLDLNNTESQKYMGIIQDIIGKYCSNLSFVNPELLKVDFALIQDFIKKEPRLKIYERYLAELFRMKEHTLSDSEEALLSEMGLIAENYANSNRLLTDLEIDYGSIKDEDRKEIKLNASNISKYSRSENRMVRKQVYHNEGEAIQKHINSLASNYIGYLKSYETEARYRKYDSYLAEKLYVGDIGKEVYTTLMDVALDNVSIYQKYLKFVKDVLGVEKLESYDLSAPLVNVGDKEYSIEDAKEIILGVFDFYGDEYKKILNYAFDSRSIDYLPCENKVTGWYSAYSPFNKPKILANYEGKILDISSLTHELGHLVNQYMIIETQDPHYAIQSTFCAEVSSLNNEIVFSRKMMENLDNCDDKKELLANYIKTFASNFFGAVKQALFEERAHQLIVDGIGISSHELCLIWDDINKEFNGNIVDNKYSNTWALIPHFLMDGGFYTFNYATGIVAASNLASKLLDGEDGINSKFLKYLSIGDSLSPLDSLKVVDIDMKDRKTYEIALNMFSNAIDEFYNLSNM